MLRIRTNFMQLICINMQVRIRMHTFISSKIRIRFLLHTFFMNAHKENMHARKVNTLLLANTWNPNIQLFGHFFASLLPSFQMVWSFDQADHSNTGHTTGLFCPVFRPPFENRTIWQPDMFKKLEYQTCLYSDGYWTHKKQLLQQLAQMMSCN